jgi:hypothetical protein
VRDEDYPELEATLVGFLRSPNHYLYGPAMATFARRWPDVLEAVLEEGVASAAAHETGVKALEEQARAQRGPAESSFLWRLPADLDWRIYVAHQVHVDVLRPSLHVLLDDHHLDAEWRQALRPFERRLNDPDPNTAAVVAAAFRTRGIELELVNGQYLPVSYDREASPPIRVEPSLSTTAPRVGAPVILSATERATRAGGRICLDGEWQILVRPPMGETQGISVHPKAPGLKNQFVRLTAEFERAGEVHRLIFNQRGRHTVTIAKLYMRDDRLEGGAWTGLTRPASITVDVIERETLRPPLE